MSDLPVHKPTVVERLAARAAADDANPVTSPEEAKAKAYDNLVQRLGDTHDPEEIKTIANAIAAVGKIAPEPEGRQELDLSGISDSALEELVAAEKTSALMRDWSPERKAAYHEERQAKAKAEELEGHEARRELQELAFVGKLYLMLLPRRWTTAGHNRELWGDSGTYKAVPYDALPPLKGPLDGSFAWLRAALPTEDGMTFEQQPVDTIAQCLAARAAEAEGGGLALPFAFLTFMTEADLYTRVPSCTACYYDLAPRLLPLPEHPGPERLLRFLNDQQACYLWYLLLEPGGGHQVVRAWPEWEDDNPPSDAESLEDMTTPRDIEICASSFEEFIKRLWIENTIWFAVNRGARLEGELREYSDAAKAAATRMVAAG